MSSSTKNARGRALQTTTNHTTKTAKTNENFIQPEIHIPFQAVFNKRKQELIIRTQRIWAYDKGTVATPHSNLSNTHDFSLRRLSISPTIFSLWFSEVVPPVRQEKKQRHENFSVLYIQEVHATSENPAEEKLYNKSNSSHCRIVWKTQKSFKCQNEPILFERQKRERRTVVSPHDVDDEARARRRSRSLKQSADENLRNDKTDSAVKKKKKKKKLRNRTAW